MVLLKASGSIPLSQQKWVHFLSVSGWPASTLHQLLLLPHHVFWKPGHFSCTRPQSTEDLQLLDLLVRPTPRWCLLPQHSPCICEASPLYVSSCAPPAYTVLWRAFALLSNPAIGTQIPSSLHEYGHYWYAAERTKRKKEKSKSLLVSEGSRGKWKTVCQLLK